MPIIAKTERLTGHRVRALQWWDTDVAYSIRDEQTPGLTLRKGLKRMSWYFYNERRVHGERVVTSKLLGHLPEMKLAEARKEAQKISGRLAAGRVEPGKRKSVKFDAALDEYLVHLRRQAERRGKAPRWAKNVEQLARTLLRPKWQRWSLAEMSANPMAVRDWHIKMTKEAGPVSANRAAQVMRAAYRHASRLNRSLPPALPTSGVAFNAETPRETGLAFKDFPAWAKAWGKIASPTRRSYYLFCLLTGARPGEAARLRWADVRPSSRSVVIAAAKAGLDITIPMSIEIVRALRMARDAGVEGEYVFPGCAHNPTRDNLPAFGNMLRHSYRTVAADLGTDEVLVRLLMGHSLQGVSQAYISRFALGGGQSLRAAQRQISRRIVGLLGLYSKA